MADRASTRRRLLRGAGVGAMGVLAGCSGDGSSDGDTEPTTDETSTDDETDDGGDATVHLVTDYANDSWEAYWETIEPEFEAETGTSVTREDVGAGRRTGDGRFDDLLQSGDPPELIRGTAAEIGDLLNAGRIRPVGDVVDDLTAQWDELTYEGDIAPLGDEPIWCPTGFPPAAR